MLFSQNALAAEFGMAIDRDKGLFITLKGPIVAGDSERLRRFLIQNRYNSLHSTGLTVDTAGGDVIEAIAIADLVEKAGFWVIVPPNGVCASSCFFIYVAAPVRTSYGRVIIHRPYYDMKAASALDRAEFEQGYREAYTLTRTYLTQRLVPDYLINLMMGQDSENGFTLTRKDIVLLRPISPAVSEYQVQNCPLPDEHDEEAQIALRKCLIAYSAGSRYSLFFGNKGEFARQAFLAVSQLQKRMHHEREEKAKEFSFRLREIVDAQPPEKWEPLARLAYTELVGK